MKRTFRKTNVMVSWGYRLVNDPGLGEFIQTGMVRPAHEFGSIFGCIII